MFAGTGDLEIRPFNGPPGGQKRTREVKSTWIDPRRAPEKHLEPSYGRFSEKSDQKPWISDHFPTQCLPCSPPPTGLPGLVSPAGYAQRSDLPDLQEPRNFRKRGEYPKQPAKNTKSRHPRKRPKSTPRSTPTSPGTHRKCPESTRKSTWKNTRKNAPGVPGKKPEMYTRSSRSVPREVPVKYPESTRKSIPKVPGKYPEKTPQIHGKSPSV